MKKKSYVKQTVILISMFLLVMVISSLGIVALSLGPQALELKNPVILQNWVVFALAIVALIVAIVFLRKINK